MRCVWRQLRIETTVTKRGGRGQSQVLPLTRPSHSSPSSRFAHPTKERYDTAMHHTSYELTESVTPVHKSSGARQSQKRIAPRVKLHPVKTTPLTRSVRTQPFRVRIQPPSKQDEFVRRKLFTAVTPRKKRPHEPVTIKVNCGRERTQPLTVDARRGSDGSLTTFLRNCISQAEQRIQAFRAAVLTQQFTSRLLENNLIFRILQREGDLFFVEHINSNIKNTTSLAVLVSAGVLPVAEKESEMKERCMFIPHPWRAHEMKTSGSTMTDVLIVPYRISLTTPSEVLPALQSHSLCQAFNESLRRIASTCNQFPHTNAEEGNDGREDLHTLNTFSNLSPHVAVVNLYVYVDFCFSQRDFAVIRDNVGELAILKAPDAGDLELQSGERHHFPSVHVLPQRVASKAVLQIVTLESNECYNQLLRCSQETLFAFSTRKPQ
ncbi:hypothetical protein FGB62_100g33 [Gracilaria domingensis]|nr:hypothetical protein FGB62_100g33 [Gracilaria domingensis]